MSHSAPSLEIDLSWRMREHEARLLAELLRTSRLTLLHAETGIPRSELLVSGVLPLLRRRASDVVGNESRESRVVIPFPDRRSRRGGRASTRVAERVVLFDGWGRAPLAALQGAILETLPEDTALDVGTSRLSDMLAELSERLEAHFLVVLDSFENFWAPGLSVQGRDEFVDELSEAVNAPGLRANFLLSISEEAKPKLDPLRRRIPGFDDSALRLLPWQSVATAAPVLREVAQPTIVRAAEAQSSVKAAPVQERFPVPGMRDAELAPPTMHLVASGSSTSGSSTAGNSGRPRRPNSPRPPRLPLPKPEPIKTEGVYAFIESTLHQTASVCAPWHETENGPSAPLEYTKPDCVGQSFEHPLDTPPLSDDEISRARMRTDNRGHSAETTAESRRHRLIPWSNSILSWLRRRFPSG